MRRAGTSARSCAPPPTRSSSARASRSADEDEDFGIETLSEELEAAVAPPIDEEEPMEQQDVPQHGFIRAQNLIHDMQPPEPEFSWEEPSPRAERERASDPVGPEREAEEPTGDVSSAGAEIRVLRPRPAESPVDELIADSDQHRREVANRVSFLFPRPETTEWQVREVGYDRTRRAEVDEPSNHLP
jgi:hypothetical protein